MMRTSSPAYSDRPETCPLGDTRLVPRILPSAPMSIFMSVPCAGLCKPVGSIACRRRRASCLPAGRDGQRVVEGVQRLRAGGHLAVDVGVPAVLGPLRVVPSRGVDLVHVVAGLHADARL